MNARQRRKHKKSSFETTIWYSPEDQLEDYRQREQYDEVDGNTFVVFVMVTLIAIIVVCVISLIQPEIAKAWLWICKNFEHVL